MLRGRPRLFSLKKPGADSRVFGLWLQPGDFLRKPSVLRCGWGSFDRFGVGLEPVKKVYSDTNSFEQLKIFLGVSENI